MFLIAFLACSTPETSNASTPPPAATEKTVANTSTDWNHYGEAFKIAEASDCKSLIASPADSVGKVIRVTGRIENVCEKAGCWMVIADDDGKYLRVSMKDHAFGVPTDTTTGPDTHVDIEGKLIAKKLDKKTLEHLKSEAKGKDADLDKQFAPKYEIVATGVAIQKS